MTFSSSLQALAQQELYAWLMIAQEDLHEATTRDDELEAEALCDSIVAELASRL